ncbi:hypothetical protein Tco_0907020 [Tanacetum coccineum]|uniref:non-specific serine/threonine protein kinase n=1 Tax=Tanacetum coccineum TaxID=301880 RepID=A0ABQ5CI42_9ASTR
MNNNDNDKDNNNNNATATGENKGSTMNGSEGGESPVQDVVDSCRTGKIVEDDRLTLETEDGATKLQVIGYHDYYYDGVRKCLNKWVALVDPRLGTNFVTSEMFRMIKAAVACVRHSATKRPRMGHILRAFESLEAEDLSNGMKVGQSFEKVYGLEVNLNKSMVYGVGVSRSEAEDMRYVWDVV